jgi:hypothetical protein
MKTPKSLDERRKENSERNVSRGKPRDKDQGICRDQRGQEQPTDKERAQRK